MIRFIPELVQRQEPVWHESISGPFLHVGEYLFVFRLWGGSEDMGRGAGAGCSPSLVYIL